MWLWILEHRGKNGRKLMEEKIGVRVERKKGLTEFYFSAQIKRIRGQLIYIKV